jgi:hypothetical protein
LDWCLTRVHARHLLRCTLERNETVADLQAGLIVRTDRHNFGA